MVSLFKCFSKDYNKNRTMMLHFLKTKYKQSATMITTPNPAIIHPSPVIFGSFDCVE